MSTNKRLRKRTRKRRRRSKAYMYSEMVRMSDGSFYTRKSPLPAAHYYDCSREYQYPASLSYEYTSRFVKKDVLQNVVYWSGEKGNADTKHWLALKSSRAVRLSNRFIKSLAEKSE